jgi:hypothetical protein
MFLLLLRLVYEPLMPALIFFLFFIYFYIYFFFCMVLGKEQKKNIWDSMQALSLPLLCCQESNVNKRRCGILGQRFILRSHIFFSFPDEKNPNFLLYCFCLFFFSNQKEIFAGIVVVRMNMKEEKRMKGCRGN